MAATKLPDLIYQGNDIPEVLRLYEQELRKGGEDFKSIAHAGAIKRYHDLITDKKFLSVLRRTFDTLYQILEAEIPDLRFSIEGRRKSMVSYEDKINKMLAENRSLDLIRDMFAFRIIIFGADDYSSQLINKCYDVMNRIITLYVSKGFTLCEEDPVVGTMEKDSPEYQKLIVPKESGISENYLYGVKDYILHPKKNGYQSLHCVFRTPSGYCFEVQVRTFGMHVYAVDGNAEHSAYKNAKYPNRLQFDRKRVHMPGYGISDNGTVFDFIGLEKPLTIFKRQKTFQ